MVQDGFTLDLSLGVKLCIIILITQKNIHMSKYCVMGKGFIGSAVANKLKQKYGDDSVCWFPHKDTEIVFFFQGPTHPDYDKNPDYWDDAGIFTKISNYCERNNVKLIYASSALVYEP